MSSADLAFLRGLVRDYPDWPIPGVTFRDLSPVMASPDGLAIAVSLMGQAVEGLEVDAVVGVEARGWPWAVGLALRRGLPFVPLRKAGKLPGDVHVEEYALEYGTAELEMHSDVLEPGHRVLLVDDVLATGGTAAAAASLVRRTGAEVAAFVCLIELVALGGRRALPALAVRSLLDY